MEAGGPMDEQGRWSPQRGMQQRGGFKWQAATLPCVGQKGYSHPQSFPVGNTPHKVLCALTIPHFKVVQGNFFPYNQKISSYSRNKHTPYLNDFLLFSSLSWLSQLRPVSANSHLLASLSGHSNVKCTKAKPSTSLPHLPKYSQIRHGD